jgi:uncharacterized protein YbjT (DUF2867 family)
MKILVTGATGYIGGLLVPRLIAAGHQIVCLARDPNRLTGDKWKSITIRQGDVLDDTSLPPVLQDIELAYYLIHSMAEGARGFEERDYIAARNFGKAAREGGVKRIIYLGGLGGGKTELSSHLASRQRVGDILRASGIPVTEFRAGVVIGSGSMSFEMIRYLTDRLPVMITPRWVTTRCQPIAIDNVLDYLTCCLTEPLSIGRTFEIGGPDVMIYGDMMRQYAAARHLKRFLIPVPVLTPRLSSYWVDLVTPIPASYSHPLIEGLRSEVIVQDPGAQEIFKIDLIPFAEAVQQALNINQSGVAATYWAGTQAGLQPGVTQKTTEGMIIEQRRVASAAEPKAVFAIFSGIGGSRGWYFANWLWQLRGLLDRFVGGVGMRQGRLNPEDLRPGDALDFWRVEAVESGRLIRLRSEIKTPGPTWLQFEAEPRPAGGTLLIQTIFFQPHGLAGVVYWYGLFLIHQLIFSGMAREIARRAESQD